MSHNAPQQREGMWKTHLMSYTGYKHWNTHMKELMDTRELNSPKKRLMNLVAQERRLDGRFVEIKLLYKTSKRFWEPCRKTELEEENG